MRRRHSSLDRSGACALLVVLALVIAACGETGDDAELVVEGTDGGAGQSAQRSLAAAASFDVADSSTERVTPEGVTLGLHVEYFEPLVVQEWTAPDECAYDTLVSALVDGVEHRSPPFDGPRSVAESDESGLLGSVTTASDSNTDTSRRFVLVVAYGHGQVVSAELPGEGGDPAGIIDTQPLDGWTTLGLFVPEDVQPEADSVDVVVSRQDEAGTFDQQVLTVPVTGGNELAVLTPEWLFDETQVGEQCVPPEENSPPGNQPAPPETDILGGEVGGKPTAPVPGEQPAEPVQATEAVLAAMRTVYDLDALYDPAKADFTEDPALGLRIQDEIRALDVVGPYLSRLDPVFDSVVFTSPTEATVLYRVGPSYHWEIGRLLLIDGTWRVALGTYCRDLGDAGYQCPGVTPDPRPGPLG